MKKPKILKPHGLLFKSEMIKALLNTKPDCWPPQPLDDYKPMKFQTRRLAEFEPLEKGTNLLASSMDIGHYCTGVPESGFVLYSKGGACWQQRTKPLHPNHGPVGRPVYAKEGWMPVEPEFDDKPQDEIKGVRVLHRADDEAMHIEGPWRNGMFMPMWAARLFFVVKRVRCERLQSISDEDALAEGIDRAPLKECHVTPQMVYRRLWSDINGAYSWQQNPWVIAYDLMRVSSFASVHAGGAGKVIVESPARTPVSCRLSAARSQSL